MNHTTAAVQNQPLVTLANGKPATTSNVIAATFGKRHDTVLRAVRKLECSPDFRLRNFAEASREVEQPNGGKATYTEYVVSRDGFMFLAMGFTGKEAAKWKEQFINAFNAMESEIRTAYSVNPGDVLTAAEAEELRLLVKAECDKLPKDFQAEFNIKAWSKLKSHFGVTYRKIPRHEFTEALSMVARHAAGYPQVYKAPALTFEPSLVQRPKTEDERMHNRAMEIAEATYHDCREQMVNERSRRVVCGTAIEDWTPTNASSDALKSYSFLADWMDTVQTNIRYDVQRLRDIYGVKKAA